MSDLNDGILNVDAACENCNEELCTCYADNATWGEVGHEIPGKFSQVYYGGNILSDDEGLYNSFHANSEVASSISIEPVYPIEEPVEPSDEPSDEPSEPVYPNYQYNKYGKITKGSSVKVTIKPHETLASQYPFSLVKIDGKTFDLARLNTAVDFVMDEDHKISIFWSENLVETFRIIAVK